METNEMPRAYSYLRFSTPEQMRGDSFRRQERMAKEYAERKGLVLDDKLTFQDLGVSAYRGANVDTGKLGDFKKAVELGAVEPGSFLLVESLDRISRNKARKALRVLENICELGITVVTLMDGKEYTEDSLDNDPTSLIMSILIFMRANEESSTKARRLSAVWKNKRDNGGNKPLTARCPAWLRLDKDKGVFEVIEDRAEIVRRIIKMYLEGTGQHTIAQTLNKEEIPTFSGGDYWHRSYIFKILENPAVIGTYVPHRYIEKDGKRVRKPLEPLENYYPAVVDNETFQRVQALRADSCSPGRGEHASSTELKNILGGLAKCPLCGGTMTRVYKGQKKKAGVPKLVCRRAKQGAGCKYKSVSLPELESVLIDKIDYIVAFSPSDTDATRKLEDELDLLREQLDSHQDARREILEITGSGKKIPTGLIQQLGELEDDIERMEKEEKELERRVASTSSQLWDLQLKDLETAMKVRPLANNEEEPQSIDRKKANALLRQVLSGVVVDFTTGYLKFQWKHGGESEVFFTFPTD